MREKKTLNMLISVQNSPNATFSEYKKSHYARTWCSLVFLSFSSKLTYFLLQQRHIVKKEMKKSIIKSKVWEFFLEEMFFGPE